MTKPAEIKAPHGRVEEYEELAASRNHHLWPFAEYVTAGVCREADAALLGW